MPASRTTGRWNTDPADDRTVFGLYTSTDASENTTAPAPYTAASTKLVRGAPVSEVRRWPDAQRAHDDRLLSDHAPVEVDIG